MTSQENASQQGQQVAQKNTQSSLLATDCNLNPLNNGVYQWGDRLKTPVEIHEDGSAAIVQGENRVELDCVGFFADVASVLDNAIDAMPDGERKLTLEYRSLPTSRSLPGLGWLG